MNAKFTTDKQPSVPPMGEIEKTLRACRFYLRKNAGVGHSILIEKINRAIGVNKTNEDVLRDIGINPACS